MVQIYDMDEAYKLAGGRGKYQLLVAVACWISLVTFMCFTFTVPYLLQKPQLECFEGGHWENCDAKIVCEGVSLVKYRFKDADRRYNFVTEFGLLCKDTEATFISSAYFIGSILSCLIVNTLSDVFGRLPLLIIGNAGNVVCIAVLMLCPSYEMCVIVSGLIGLITIGNNSNSYSYVYDSFESSCAIFYGTTVSLAWAVGEVLIALCMWTGIEWRGMLCVLIMISSSFFILLCWLVESPRFYFSKMEFGEALKKLKHIANVNGAKLPEGLTLGSPAPHLSGESQNRGNSFKQTLKAICCSVPMLLKIILFSYCFSASTFVFYALSLNLEKMTGNIYVLGLITAIAEMVSCVFAGALLERIGKKVSLVIYFVVAGAGVFCQGLTWDNSTWSVFCAYFTKFGSTAADSALYLFVAELYPTSVKGVAFGTAIFVSRFASVLAKPLSLLDPMLMCSIMAGMSLAAAAIGAFLPIKSNAIISDFAELENYSRVKPLINQNQAVPAVSDP